MKLPVSNTARKAAILLLVAVATGAPLAAQSIETDGEVKATGFDGDGSKLTNVDAETLDGIDSPALATETEVIPLVLAGDGPGSGLDADRLDGLDSTAFARTTDLGVASSQLECFARTLGGRVFTEVEPNDSAAAATPYCLGRGSGRVGGTQEDWWSAPAQAGNLVFAWADTTFSAFTVPPIQDSLLDVFANNGTTLIESDDNDGTPFGSAVVAGATVPQSGRVFTRVREAMNGTSITYRLFQVVANPGDAQAEVEPNDNAINANVVDTQTIITGFQPTSLLLTADWFQFFAPSIARINVILDEDPDRDGLPTSVTVDIVTPDGLTVLGPGSFGGVGGPTPPDAEAYGATTIFAGNYFVRINSAAFGTDADGDYRFVIQVIQDEG